jgi:hypothetical protein
MSLHFSSNGHFTSPASGSIVLDYLYYLNEELRMQNEEATG